MLQRALGWLVGSRPAAARDERRVWIRHPADLETTLRHWIPRAADSNGEGRRVRPK